MKNEFAELPHTSLRPGTGYVTPPRNPELVHLDSPAIDVMTNLRHIQAVTTTAGTCIDAALEHMKSAGVRLLLVTDDQDSITGLISARDIQGERPIRLIQEEQISRDKITVAQVMEGLDDISVLNSLTVRSAEVRHIVDILHHLERQHVLVVDTDHAGQQVVIGLFSLSQISRQLPKELRDYLAPAHSLAEIVHQSG